MTDPTQVPPFGVAVTITAGVVTDILGVANAHWTSEQNDPALVLAPDGTRIGDLYDGRDFTRPADQQPIPKGDPDGSTA